MYNVSNHFVWPAHSPKIFNLQTWEKWKPAKSKICDFLKLFLIWKWKGEYSMIKIVPYLFYVNFSFDYLKNQNNGSYTQNKTSSSKWNSKVAFGFPGSLSLLWFLSN